MEPEARTFKLVGGIETEHDVTDRHRLVDSEKVMEAVKRIGHCYGICNGTSVWGDNGCRAYNDVAMKVEYAGPECKDGDALATHDLAGTIFWALMAEDADLASERTTGETRIMRTNTSHNGEHGGGSHLNVSMPVGVYPREVATHEYFSRDFKRTVALLRSFVSSLQLLVGTGVVLPKSKATTLLEGANYGFAISPRAYHVAKDYGSANTGASREFGDKPLFMDRNEPHADSSKTWRFQISGLDTNILFDNLKFKVDATLLVCEMAAAGKLKLLVVKDPSAKLHLARAISLDWQREFKGDKVEPITALDMQWFYYHQAEAYVQNHRGGRGQEILDTWYSLLKEFDSGEKAPTALIGRVDWITKYHMIQLAEAKLGASVTYRRAEWIHFDYHAFRLFGAGLCTPLRLIVHYGPPNIIERLFRALCESPTGTRAEARGAFVRAHRTTSTVNWAILSPTGYDAIKLPDPAATSTPEFEAHMSSLAAAA